MICLFLGFTNISIGHLFLMNGSNVDFKGAALGRTKLSCLYRNEKREPNQDFVGYIYFPMPFWHSAKITLSKIFKNSQPTEVCYQIKVEGHTLDISNTGYFNIHTAMHDKIGGYMELLNVQQQWGHVVGNTLHVDFR